VAENGLLRALRAEARREERTRVRDMLSAAAVAADEQAGRRKTDSRGRWATPEARKAAGLREALSVFDRRFGLVELAAGEPYLSLSNAVDSVELFQYDEPERGEDEPMPVRLAVHDGADDSTACAYLSLDEAEQVFREGLALVEQIRQRRADRPSSEDQEGADSHAE
jgi:hypothetical protein